MDYYSVFQGDPKKAFIETKKYLYTISNNERQSLFDYFCLFSWDILS